MKDRSYINCLRPMLVPIIRYSLRKGVRLKEFVELTKEVFIKVAREELESSGSEATVNRISIASGVHRKDVNRVDSGNIKGSEDLDVLSRIIGQWKNNSNFSNKYGKAKNLSFNNGDGDFATLTRSVSKELNPYSVLAELERLGLVKRENDDVILIANEFVPSKDIELSFALLENDFSDLIQAVEFNTTILSEAPSLHLTTRYDNICPEYIPEIKKWMMKEGEEIHHKARNFLSKYDKDLNPSLWKKSGGAKVVIGTFSNTVSHSSFNGT